MVGQHFKLHLDPTVHQAEILHLDLEAILRVGIVQQQKTIGLPASFSPVAIVDSAKTVDFRMKKVEETVGILLVHQRPTHLEEVVIRVHRPRARLVARLL